MTVPDATPTVEDVIAEALTREVWISFSDSADDDGTASGVIDADDRRLLAAAVVAAIRDMTAVQQAELLDGMTEHARSIRVVDDVVVATRVRVVGPWRAEP